MSVRTGVVVMILLCCTAISQAQAPTAVVNGQVRDTSGAAIPNATVEIINDATRVRYTTETNSEGIYSVPNLPPGTYHIQVSKIGFKTIVHPDVVLHVQDADAIGFTLPIGAISETVTVQGGAPLINTESAAVGTVVDRKYVENMPLNGRSIQGLILLTPGVVTNTTQIGAGNGINGEFSVNGQRTESNYYTVDGVSANVGISSLGPGTPGGESGSVPASTALGTTQGLVTMDALEEFRVQSSTYSAEYGRNPGGQFSFVTRSGTNQWNGTAFEYLRNNIFDANDWFNGYFSKSHPPERQNDFGGTLGGPVQIPHLYNGKDKTFFFFSYEGLRLAQPQAAFQTAVPDANLRANTPSPLQQVLNAFPVANGSDLGNGLANFIGTWSNPSQIDAVGIRLDHVVNERLKLFFRFNNASSSIDARNLLVPSVRNPTTDTIRTYTFGATSSFSNKISNQLRINYSTSKELSSFTSDNFGGAQPVDLFKLQGFAGATRVLFRRTVWILELPRRMLLPFLSTRISLPLPKMIGSWRPA